MKFRWFSADFLGWASRKFQKIREMSFLKKASRICCDFGQIRTVWRGLPHPEADFSRFMCMTCGVFLSAVRARTECWNPAWGGFSWQKHFFLYACRTFFFDGSSAGASMSRIAWHSRACMSLGSRRFLGKKLSMSLKKSCMSSFRTCIKTRRHLKERGVS